MRILSYSEISPDQKCVTFRNHSWLALVGVALLIWGIAIYAFIPKAGQESIYWGVFPAFFGSALFLTAFMRLRVCMKESAWLLRQAEEGLYVNLRTYQNYHLPPEEHRVLFIPAQEVAAICKTHETRMVPDRRHSHRDRFTFLDIFVKEQPVDELREALRRERRLEPKKGWFQRRKHLEYPVRALDPPGVRLVWDWIKPGENRALDLLGRQYPIAPDQKVKAEVWEALSEEQREALIVQFWEWGYVEDALRLGKMKWNVGEWRARKMLEERVAAS